MSDIIISIGLRDTGEKTTISITRDEYDKANTAMLGRLIKDIVTRLEAVDKPSVV